MTSFELNNKEYNLPSDWSEVNLSQYIRVLEMQRLNELVSIPEMQSIEFLEILTECESGELDDLPLRKLAELGEVIAFLRVQPKGVLPNHFTINGVDYATESSLLDLSVGEWVSIKTFQEAAGEDTRKWLPQAMAILIRPAKKVVKHETGKVKWVLDKFNAKDIDDRAEIFMKGLSVEVIAAVAKIFFSSSEE